MLSCPWFGDRTGVVVRPVSEPRFPLRPLGLAPAQGVIFGTKTLPERPFRLDVPSALAEAGDRLWPPLWPAELPAPAADRGWGCRAGDC